MEYVHLDFASKVPECDLESNKPCFYLPHKAVFKQSSSTHMRIIFDGSSHRRDQFSFLNNCLDAGVNLNSDIYPFLLRINLNFRLDTYGITADCSKAFLRILIRPEKYNFCRCLWIDQDDLNNDNPQWAHSPTNGRRFAVKLADGKSIKIAQFLSLKKQSTS